MKDCVWWGGSQGSGPLSFSLSQRRKERGKGGYVMDKTMPQVCAGVNPSKGLSGNY